jgi:hypothetical protein
MKTIDVKCGQPYMLDNQIRVTVIRRIIGKETKKRNMQSGIMFTGYARTCKKFELDNGEIVYSKRLTPLKQN